MKRTTVSVAIFLATFSPVAAQPTFEELQRQTEDITKLIDAENSKSALCKRYVGTVVSPTTFEALAMTMPKIAEKGEYETTAQYEARKAAALAKAPSSLSVLIVPTDRDYSAYNADGQSFFVQAGAFQAGRYSENVAAQAGATSALRDDAPHGIGLHISEKARVLSTYNAQNVMGAKFRVNVMDRDTKALHLLADELFPFATRKSSPVMGMDLSLAKAPLVKKTFKVALVLRPAAPYVLHGLFDELPATARRPEKVADRAILLVVEPKCGLVLDSSFRVLASADAGN